jgi:hypothetical protein
MLGAIAGADLPNLATMEWTEWNGMEWNGMEWIDRNGPDLTRPSQRE